MSDELKALKALYEQERKARLVAEQQLLSLKKTPQTRSQQLQDINKFLQQAVGVQISELQAAKGVAESKKLAAESANFAKSTFLANMSHEIRTPLTAIIGFSENLKNGIIEPEEQPRIIDIIIDNGKHLLALINDILDMSKIEANQLDIEHIEVDVFTLLQDIYIICQPNAQQKSVDFIINVDNDVPQIITSDPTRLKQILLNICNNAVKFTAIGAVTIQVSYFMGLNTLEIDVIDTGIGISHKKAENLFNAFTQADESTTRQYGGTGLGLYISKQLAQMLGGDITLETKLGHGSTFSISIDCGETIEKNQTFEEFQQTQPQSKNKISIPKLQGRVLLAEDNNINQKLISMNIRATGAHTDVVNDGQKAVEQALSQDYDLILMDIQMPKMDGKEAMATLAALGYSSPVVALTANVINGDMESYTTLGFHGALAKPIDLKKFYATLKEHLSPHQVTSELNYLPFTDNNLPFNDPFMFKLRQQFLNSLNDYLIQISDAEQHQDWKKLINIIHIIKGTAGSFGFMPITLEASRIQELLRNNDYDQATPLLSNLKSLMLKAQDELHTLDSSVK